MDAIKVEDVRFSYGKTPVLKGVDFSVPEGSFAVLLGENGAGKSTLLRLLLGELPLGSSNGRIELLGEDVRRFRHWEKLSYVSQYAAASCQNFPASVEEIVRANLYAQVGPFRFAGKREREAVRLALSEVGMEKEAKRLIGELSGGQQQRVLLARALVNRPELIFLDEPTSGMDENSTALFYFILRQINRGQGTTVLVVTHDRNRLELYGDVFWKLENGRIRETT